MHLWGPLPLAKRGGGETLFHASPERAAWDPVVHRKRVPALGAAATHQRLCAGQSPHALRPPAAEMGDALYHTPAAGFPLAHRAAGTKCPPSHNPKP